MIGAPPGGFGKKHTPGGLFLSFNIQKAHRRAGCRHLFTIDKQCFYFVTYMIGIKIWLDQLQNRSIRLFEKTWCSVEVEVVVIVVVVVVVVVGCSCLIASKLSECLVEFVTDGLVFLLLSQKFIFQSINLLLELRHCPLSFCGTVFSILKAACKIPN